MTDAWNEPLDENALLGQAHAANARGEPQVAIELLERLLAGNPAHPEARRGLAHVMFNVGDRVEAVEHMRRAITGRPERATWHFELGKMLADSGRADEALKEFRCAEGLDPNNSAYPGRIAMLGPHLRNPSIVGEAAERALKLNPNESSALLALTRDAVNEGRLDDAEELAERVIRSSPPPLARASTMHQVGRLEERRRRWKEAFEAHEAANKMKLAMDPARAALRAPMPPFLPYLGHADAAERYREWGARRYDDGIPEPVVLTGFPRSGTTLGEQILAAHPGVSTSEEQSLCRPVRTELDAMLGGGADFRSLLDVLDELTDDQVRSLRATYRRELERFIPAEDHSKTLVDKHPMRILDLGLMNRLFPGCRVVFMIRDPRDVCVSAFFQDFVTNPGTVRCLSLPMCVEWYAKVMGFWLKLRAKLSIEVQEIRYEDLVADFDTWARRMLEVAGVEWDPCVREFYKPASERLVRSASYEAVTEKLNSRSIGRWKRYADRLGPVLEKLDPFVEAFGYEPSDAAL